MNVARIGSRSLSCYLLLGLLYIQFLPSCVAIRDRDEIKNDRREDSVRYNILAEPAAGASFRFESVYVFPALKMSKDGSALEKMSPILGKEGDLVGWSGGGKDSAEITRRMKRSFRSVSHELYSFPQLLESSDPYSVLVVSAFYSEPTRATNYGDKSLDRSVIVKVNGVLFNLDLDPSTSLPVGTVVCKCVYSSARSDEKELIGRLINEAIYSVGDDIEGCGVLNMQQNRP